MEISNEKSNVDPKKLISYKLISPFLLLAASLGVLLLILKTPLAGIFYHNPLAHSFVLLAFTVTLFFICFLAYQRFARDKDTRWYILSLAFFIRGVFAFAHAVLVPAFGWGDEALFDISEHYGLFLAALLLKTAKEIARQNQSTKQHCNRKIS